MATLRSICGHYTFVLWFHLLLSSYFFPRLISVVHWSQSGCLPYFYTWCGLSANLECSLRYEMCCTRLAGNTFYCDCYFLWYTNTLTYLLILTYRTQKWCKNSPSAHHRTTLSGWIFATKARIDNRKDAAALRVRHTSCCEWKLRWSTVDK